MKKTLVILSPAFASSEDSTVLPAQAKFVKTLNRCFPGLRIVILAFHLPVISSDEYEWSGNRVIAFGGGKGKLKGPFLWRRVWRRLKEIFREQDVIGLFSFFCSESAFVGHYFARCYKLRHFIWILGQDARPGNKQVRRIKPKSDELIAISDFLVRHFEENYGIKPGHMLPIGVDPSDYKLGYKRDIDILGAGSLSPLKRYDVFVWVVGEIKKARSDVRALLCGGGTEYQKLQTLVFESGLQNNLEIAGTKEHEDVLDAMQRTKILLHSSSYEGFGMVCAEALAAGAHVISFCRPLDAEISHWHIVASKEEMVAKALELLSDPKTVYRSVIPHDIHDTATRLMELYGYVQLSERSRIA